jgi:hypothetical protein
MKNLIQKLIDFFVGHSSDPYSIVEMKIDSDGYRQGIRLNQPKKFRGIIVTTNARVGVAVVDDELRISFDYVVHRNPNNIDLHDHELRPLIGSAIADMITKDTNAFRITNSQHSIE